MQVTLVTFSVLATRHTVSFIDKTMAEIHRELADLWPTYHPERILQCNQVTELPCEALTQLKDPAAPDFLRTDDYFTEKNDNQ